MHLLQLFCQSKWVNETELYLRLSYGRTTWELLCSQRKHRAISCFTCFLPEARTTIHFSISAGLSPSSRFPQSTQTLILLVLKSKYSKEEKQGLNDLENWFLMDFSFWRLTVLPWYWSCKRPRERQAVVHSSAIAMSVLPALCTRAAAGDIRDVASTPPSPQHAEAEHQWGPAQPPQMLREGAWFWKWQGAIGGLGMYFNVGMFLGKKTILVIRLVGEEACPWFCAWTIQKGAKKS